MRAIRKERVLIAAALAAILTAFACRLQARAEIGGEGYHYLRAVIYIVLFICWGISLDLRILQKQVLAYLRAADILMLLWIVLQMQRELFVHDVAIARFLWYLYSLPLLFLPLVGVYIALSLGKPEAYRIPVRGYVWALIPTALMFLVLGKGWSCEPLYYACQTWVILSIVYFLVILWRRKRTPLSGRRWLWPFLLGCVLLSYCILYLIGLPVVYIFLGDRNVVLCVLYAAIFESCIQCRMIQSNKGYREMFEASTVAAQIVDMDGKVILRSHSADEETVHPKPGQSIIREDGHRVSAVSVHGGYVVWQENLERLLTLQSQLRENRKALEHNKAVLQKVYLVQKQLYELREKNLLYEALEHKLDKQTEKIRHLLEQCKSFDENSVRKLFKMVVVLGAYIKRSANLYFLAQEYENIPAQEVRLTFDESIRALTAYGAECTAVYRIKESMCSAQVIRFYDLLEQVIEAALLDLRSLVVVVSDQSLNISVECSEDLSAMAWTAMTIQKEDGVWLLRTVRGDEEGAGEKKAD